ncbi:ATP-binding Cassette (ABC) Superfamily, partial [Achlya hypogyna]
MLRKDDVPRYSTFDAPAKGEAPHPQDEASTVSWFSFAWVVPFLRLGNTRQLAPDDMWALQDVNRVGRLAAEFKVVYDRKNKGILTSFFVIYWAKFSLLGVLQLFTVVCDLYGPGYVLQQVIAAVEAPTVDTTYVLQLIASLYASQFVNAFVKSHMNYMNDVIGIQFSSSLRSMLFEKALRLNASSKKKKTAGDIANLFSTDVINVMAFALSIHQIWIVPCQIAFVLYLLYNIVGWSIFVGLGLVALLLVVNAILAVMLGQEEEHLFKLKDDRMKVVNEVFGSIQIIKFNAWEEKFLAKIRQLRDAELGSIGRFFRIVIALISFMNCTPVLVTVTVFATFTLWMQEALTVTIVFSTLALFKSLQDALVNLPIVIMSMVQSLVSAKRINDVLHMDEVDPDNVWTPEHPIAATYAKDEVVVAIDDGTFGWDKETPLFRNINLKVKKGELVVVHGAVGQGKSSLCSILLGEMHKAGGSVFVGGRVAYFAQQSWIQNTTIRENILFGKPYRSRLVPQGTRRVRAHEARISLARACYSDADIFLLDSPLSAVDAIVASEIFSKCFLGLLSQKTVLLVTHNPEIIESKAVHRTFLVQDGQLIESTLDSPRTLQEVPVTPLQARTPYWEEDAVVEYPPATTQYDQLVTPSLRSPYHFKLEEMLFTPAAEGGKATSFEETGRLIAEEERAEGRVSKEVVVNYVRALGGCSAVIVIFVLTLSMQVAKLGSDLWLTHWANVADAQDSHAFAETSNINMGIYAGLALGSCLLVAAQTFAILGYGLGASQRMFDAMLKSLLAAPMRFFDTNPIGRILNRLGDDVSACDLGIPFTLGPILYESSSALFTITTAIVLTQAFGLLVLPLLYVYFRLGAFFLEPLREVNRIQKTTRSPLISLVSEGIDGSTTIRAFGAKQLRRFYRLNTQKIETFCEARVANTAINAWFSMRMQALSSTIVVILLVALVALHDSLNPGLVGLLITYGLNIPNNLMYLVNMWSQLE